MPDPVLVPVDPVPPPAPSIGQKIITMSLAVLGALPSSGLFGETSTALKISGLVVIGLAALGYNAHGTALRAAHAAGRRSAALGANGGAS